MLKKMTYYSLSSLMGLWWVISINLCGEVHPLPLPPTTYLPLSFPTLLLLPFFRYLPMYTGRPDLTDLTHYGVRNVFVNTSAMGNFLTGCVAANVSSVDSLLHHR